MISGYNTPAEHSYHVKNLMKIVSQELSINGFVVGSLREKYVDEFYATFPRRVAAGEIKHKEYPVRGLEQAGKAIVDVLTGKNFGKCVVVVAEE